MTELRYILRQFRLAKKRPDNRFHSDLKDMGVSPELIDQLYAAHAACLVKMAKAELRLRCGLIPKLNAWLKTGWEGKQSHEFFFWRAHASRMHDLERDLRVDKRHGLDLEIKLDEWWRKHSR